MSKAVVPISGGLDSSVILSIACKQHDDVYAISYDYGQKHNKELLYAGCQSDAECAQTQEGMICSDD